MGDQDIRRPEKVAQLTAAHTGPNDMPQRQSREQGDAKPRYQFETPLGHTAISELVRAVDTVLDRSVIIERFEGISNPEDETIVLALLCKTHGCRGTYVAPYGKDMPSVDATLIRKIPDGRKK